MNNKPTTSPLFKFTIILTIVLHIAIFIYITIFINVNPLLGIPIVLLSELILCSLIVSIEERKSFIEEFRDFFLLFGDFIYIPLATYLLYVLSSIIKVPPIVLVPITVWILVPLMPFLIEITVKTEDISDENSIRLLHELKKKMNISKNIKLKLFASDLLVTAIFAGTIFASIYVNKKLSSILNQEEIKAVLAHELAHYKEKHLHKSTMFHTILCIALFGIMYLVKTLKLPYEIILPVILAFFVLSFLYARHNEIEADIIAARVTNPGALISALQKIKGKTMPLPLLYPHPSLKKRIEIIRKAVNSQ